MKKAKLGRMLIVVIAVVLVFAYCGTTLASGNISGREYGYSAYTGVLSYADNKSSTEMLDAMSPGGVLYDNSTKAVALTNPGVYATIFRVRVYPEGYGSDLRIDPYYSSNWVGPGQSNYTKQVLGVQTVLHYWPMGEYDDGIEIDGICGPATIAEIKAYQRWHNLTDDGIVGPNTWRALCSSRYWDYGTDTW